MMKQLRRCGGILAVLLSAHNLAAQQVLGRAVRELDGSPLLEALIVLLDDSGHERARTVTSPTGGFQLRASEPGRYRLRVQQIGQRGWETATFDLADSQTSQQTLRVPDRPFELHELSASARRPNCAITLGDASLGANLLQAAQTSLALAEAEITRGKRSYQTETYRRVVPLVGPPEDSVVVQDRLAGWPIQSADPESLRTMGFVHGDWPAPSPINDRPENGPTYFGPDARVLFTDWFLGTHCVSVETSDRPDDTSPVVARFKPAKGTHATVALQGSLEFDRRSLALHSLDFQFVARPRWAPPGSAGGEIRFGRLPDGAWVPVRWHLRAPVPKVVGEVPRYRLFGVVETGGRVTAIYDTAGQRDRRAEEVLNLPGP
ncbi:MAG TPA: carboxypeptidase-like regulatory domain-containing protein [Gemmatimonadales bacterium]|nr:carboxypeptidase-like regulatory domain-containing protein [Gemmatimonadales bacterium]